MTTKNLEDRAIAAKETFPMIHQGNPYAGKVRFVNWFSLEQSHALAERRGYDIHHMQELGAMISTDGISAFDTNWKGEKGLKGVPNKGAVLNHISEYFFKKLQEEGLGDNHIVEVVNPLMWIVKKTLPIRVEGIQRSIITGSMFRKYKENPDKPYCGYSLPVGLQNYDTLSSLLLTPTTKGTMCGLLGVPAREDTPISRQNIIHNLHEFGFKDEEGVQLFEKMQKKGFYLAEEEYARAGYLLGDKKDEYGYVKDNNGEWQLIRIDEFGTPDATRLYRLDNYKNREPGKKVKEESKEAFREHLLATVDKDLLLNDERYEERKEFSRKHEIPLDHMLFLSGLYIKIAEDLTKQPVPVVDRPREQIMSSILDLGLAS